MKELTPREWELYRHIEESGAEGIHIKELARLMGYEKEEKKYESHTSAYRDFHEMKESINSSSQIDKIVIISKGYRYRLGTKEDVQKLQEKYLKRALDYLRRSNTLKRKMRQDGQGKLLNNACNPLKKGNDEFHETYIGGDEE